ncbi:MAG TPA: FAD-dependent monooxygenase [Sphingomonas sp.]
MRRTDTLIVGGGPAGSASAIRLAQAGRRPLLIERSREGLDSTCGGFLSWTTLAALERLGIDRDALRAEPVDSMAIFSPTGSARTRLPALAAAVSRRRLDRLLIERAAQAGAAVERGTGVRRLDPDRALLADGGEFGFESLVLATGKHDLRGAARPPAADGPMVGLSWSLGVTAGLRAAVARTIELHLFRGGYAGLVLQEESANLCLAIDRDRLDEAGGRPDALLRALAAECPVLADRIGAASAMGGAKAIANMPYGWRARRTAPGLYRVGDQAGVVPSFAGEGIALALTGGAAAADALLRGMPAETFQPRLARRLRRPLMVAGATVRLAKHPAGARVMVSATGRLPSLARLVAGWMRI